MPELPEVETTRLGVAPFVIRQTIAAVQIYDPRLRWPVPVDLPKYILGQEVRRLDRRSKYLLFQMGQGTLLIHFGMTGSLRVYRSLPSRERHDHADFCFGNGVTLRYHDPRRFGAILWIAPPLEAHPLLAKLGPEPFSPAFNASYLYKSVRKRHAAIKLALMDNQVVVGVGNIYANEALFRAGIKPTRPANRISQARIEKLVAAVRETLEEAIAAGGSTLRDYVDSQGEPGYFQLGYQVYGRAGEPCRVCGDRIKLARLGGRGSCYCPKCQA